MAYHGDLNIQQEEDSNGNVSRINSAGLINSILENLWRESYNAMAKGEFVLWNSKLDSIWTILGGDCEDGDDVDTAMSALNLRIYERGSLKSKSGLGFNQQANPNNAIQYHLLLKKSLFLRRLQNKQGKGTAYQRDDDDDID